MCVHPSIRMKRVPGPALRDTIRGQKLFSTGFVSIQVWHLSVGPDHRGVEDPEASSQCSSVNTDVL